MNKHSMTAPAENLINTNICRLQDRLQHCAAQYGREAEAITILAISKKQPLAALRQAYQQGLRAFGENYLQEALPKIAALPDDITWHFTGPIQSRKLTSIVSRFHWVHSLDRPKLAHRLATLATELATPVNICLQINSDEEPAKAGFSPDATDPALNESLNVLKNLPNVHVRGLMCLPAPQQLDPQAPFQHLNTLMTTLNHEHQLAMDTLSMGTSADWEAAIAAGSTIIRPGTAIFGPRH